MGRFFRPTFVLLQEPSPPVHRARADPLWRVSESAGWVRGIGPVIASDKSDATIYSYGTGKVVTGIELPDTEGNLINGTEGYARIAKCP